MTGADTNHAKSFLTLEDLVAERTTQVPSIWGDGVLAGGTLSILGGEGGVGKTSFAMDLTMSLAIGQQYLGLAVPRPASVLYLIAEGPRKYFLEHLRQLCAVHNVPQASTRWMSQHPRELPQLEDVEGFSNLLDDTKPDIVVLDTYGFFTRVDDENDNSKVMRLVIKPVLDLAKKHETAFLLIHHINKRVASNGRQYLRGASEFHNKADTVLMLSQRSGTGHAAHEAPMRLTFDKLRNAPPLPPFDLVLDTRSRTYGLAQHQTSPYTAATRVPKMDRNLQKLPAMFESRDSLTGEELLGVIQSSCTVKSRQARNILDEAVTRGFVVKKDDQYHLAPGRDCDVGDPTKAGSPASTQVEAS